jgi:hypothetical protein
MQPMLKPILYALNGIVLSGLAALAYRWPPAAFGFLLVGPLSLLSIWGTTRGGMSARTVFVTTAALTSAGIFGASYFTPLAFYGLLIVVPFIMLGLFDMLQTRRAIPRNFPVIGHFRYLLEGIRPEIQQYFIESNIDGRPFPREEGTGIRCLSAPSATSTRRVMSGSSTRWCRRSRATRIPGSRSVRRPALDPTRPPC